MNFPVNFSIAHYTISAHLVFETLAFFTGFRYFLFLRRREGDQFTDSKRTWIIIAAIFGALIGSRLIGSLERPDELSHTSNLLSYVANNRTVLGGFLGGLFAVELSKKWIGEKKSSGDLFVYPIILALIIGRIGCFSSGVYEETYGKATSLPWGMDLGDHISRHPVTLYEIIFLLVLWASLKTIDQMKRLAEGALFKLFLVSYLLFRFFLDFIKPHYPVLAGFSTIQLTSVLGLLYYLPFIIRPKKLLQTAYA
jgi:phosphatidylglycerol---prolipoprotein diacylglyceryl transferase